MKVKLLGHAAFLITADEGTKIVTDPYQVGGGIAYDPITEPVDIATVSHEHADHNNATGLKGHPEVMKEIGSKEIKGITFKGIATYHDSAKGGQRGKNTIFVFNVNGVNLCHVGDLGHQLSDEDLAALGKVDVLFLPVGGVFTIDPAGATALVDAVKPRIAIPMHFKTDKCGFPLAPVDDFLAGKSNVKQVGGSEVEITKDKLPATTEIVVLRPSL